MDKAAVKALSSCLCCLMRMPSKNLKASYVYQDKTEKYMDMLKECFGICIDINSNTVGICEECVGRLRDASSFKVQVQRCQVQLGRLMQKVIQVLQEVEEPEVKSEIAVDNGTSDNLLASAPLLPEMADGGAPRQESALRECTLTHAELETEPEVNSEMPSEEDETGDEMCRNQSPVACSPAAGAASDDDSAAPGCVGMFGSGALSARARQQLAMTSVVRLERLRQSQCQPCHVATDHEASLTTHMEDMHTDSAGLRAEEEACTCDTCGEQFTDKTDLVDHMQTHLANFRFCKICSKSFASKFLFADHSRIHKAPKASSEILTSCNLNKRDVVQAERTPYSCDICNKSFEWKCFLSIHMNLHTRQKPYKCEICQKRFDIRTALAEHMRIHSSQRPYKCKTCGKQFKQNSHLKSHARIHTGTNTYDSDICTKRLTLKDNLRTHMTTHFGQIPYYKCDICNKLFTESSKLKIHIRIHTGEKPYKCEICNKRFSVKSTLNTHFRIHSGEKPYKCEICNKQFSQKSGLNTHMRIHTGQKPYKCEICNKRFTLKGQLNRHMSVHTGQKP